MRFRWSVIRERDFQAFVAAFADSQIVTWSPRPGHMPTSRELWSARPGIVLGSENLRLCRVRASQLIARPRQTNFHVPSGPPAATQPPTLPKQPPAHREPPMPLSARQRKQIFMHSTVMDPAGPTPQSRYVFANQATFIDEVNRRICHSPRAPPEVVMPTPQDASRPRCATQPIGVLSCDVRSTCYRLM